MAALPRVAFALCAAAAAMPATVAAGALPVGYDISFPQCGQPFPVAPAFAIVGVNGGRPFSPNPCLGAGTQPSQLAWGGAAAELYINTANPGPGLSTRWPRGQTAPRECDTPARPGADTADCAYDYGWNAAADAYSTAVLAYQSVGLAPPGTTTTPAAAAWWLDVETENDWRPDPALNVAAIQGSVDFLRGAGAANVGIYSVKSGWTQITGDTKAFEELPSWDAGPANQVEAEATCGYPGNTGGGVAMAQFFLGRNVRCPPVLELSSKLSAVAGAALPVPLFVAPAQNTPLTVTVTGGSLASSASGPWSGSQSVVVGAGRRTGAAVYFRRRKAGTAAITAFAPGAATARFAFEVKPAPLATLRIAPRGSLSLRVGRSIRLRASGRDRFGNGVKAVPRWTMKPSLGRLSRTGSTVRITATRPGRAVITARSGSVAKRIRVVIRS
jgi:hypothetical protein